MTQNFEITCSRGFPDWLAEQRVSLWITTYPSHRLLRVGLKPDERLRAGISVAAKIKFDARPNLLGRVGS